ncbi:MAG: tripartite tricarboxylate transporter substrate binding protein [Clostridiales bacterium]|nr:tripartite tricarboxylate transporter substrate binding protein [Clostridiales bacterium]
MKKFLALLLAAVMVCALCACGNTAATTSPAPEATPAPEAAPAAEPEAAETPAPLDYPTKTVTIICPYSAGGGTDLLARAIADYVGAKWGVSVIVEDQTGGGGAVGMSACANADNDGYTVILTALAAATITPILNDVGYTNENFAPICQVTEMVTALCVNSSSGITSIEELIEAGSANPGAMTYGTTGATSFQNILMQTLMEDAGVPDAFSHVPFDGGAAAITATVGKQTDIVVAMVPDLLPYIESGDLTPLIVFKSERDESLPEVPCAGELGYSSSTTTTWYGFAAPAGTPEAILDFWSDEVGTALADPALVEILSNINQTPIYKDRETFTELYNNTYAQNLAVLG